MTMTREKLENLANFGRNGTVNRTVEITDVTAPITEALLSDFEVFFIGYLNDSSANAFTNAELFAFEAWVNGGGNMVVTCDSASYDAVCAHFGHPATTSSVNPHTPTAEGAVHPLFDGPFGAAASINMAGTQGYFTATGGATVLAEDAGGNPTVLEKRLGAGRVVLLADVNIIAVGGLTAGDAITNNNDRFLANLFAYAGPNRPVANDFNGDGHGDILWRNTSNSTVVIHMIEDFVRVASRGIGTVSVATWDMVGTGDFNRDGRADILWHNTSTGATVMWQMNGFSRTAQTIGVVPLVWEIKGITDYNDDGSADILWRHTGNGVVVAWEMNGFTRKAAHGMGGAPTVWQIEN
ncbi:MAG: VCBS repeat-containing protein [Rhodospirillales bacterium]|nr:VCBS repeat-containing protein [Rhodospirillales bacterium]